MADDGWEVATKSGRKKRGGGNYQPSNLPSTFYTQQIHHSVPTEKSIARSLELNDDARRDLLNSPFYSNFTSLISSVDLKPSIQLLQGIQELVIYGLGSLEQPGAIHIRYQLALGCQLIPMLPNLLKPPETYDPVYTPLDQAVLPQLGLTVLQQNEQGRRIAQVPTLFYMPHCEAELTDNLLAANETAGTLQNVVVLGNSFEKYKERWSMMSAVQQSGKIRPETMLRLLESGKVEEIAVPECGFDVTAAFNDMSLHMFK